MSNRAARLHYSRSLHEIRGAFEINPEVFIEKLQKTERIRQRNRSLFNLLNALLPLRLFRTLRVKSVFGVRFRITHRPSEASLLRSCSGDFTSPSFFLLSRPAGQLLPGPPGEGVKHLGIGMAHRGRGIGARNHRDTWLQRPAGWPTGRCK